MEPSISLPTGTWELCWIHIALYDLRRKNKDLTYFITCQCLSRQLSQIITYQWHGYNKTALILNGPYTPHLLDAGLGNI